MSNAAAVSAAPSRSRSALALLLVTLGLGLGSSQALAAELAVTSSGGDVVVVLDGSDQQQVPFEWFVLDGGPHTLGFRATPFGPVVFTQALQLEEEERKVVTVDLASRKAEVVTSTLAPPEQPEPPAADASENEAEAAAESADEPPPLAEPEPPPPPREPMGDLYVMADIEGALVLLDGETTGLETPTMLRDVREGEHELMLRTECGRARSDVTVKEGLIERVELELQLGPGSLSVATQPEGATILLDGEDIGVSPKVVKGLECGGHSLVLRAPGYLEAVETIRMPAFEVTHVELELVKETYGTLVVAPNPLDAEVRIDGILAGQGPMTIEGVGSGTHTMEIRATGYQPWQNDFDIYEDQVTRLDMVLLSVEEKSTLADLPWGRLTVNTAVTGGGVVLGALALADFGEASDRFQIYLDEPDDDVAEAYFEEEVAPLKRKSAMEGVGAVALLGVGTALWLTTDFQLAVGPSGLGLQYNW